MREMPWVSLTLGHSMSHIPHPTSHVPRPTFTPLQCHGRTKWGSFSPSQGNIVLFGSKRLIAPAVVFTMCKTVETLLVAGFNLSRAPLRNTGGRITLALGH